MLWQCHGETSAFCIVCIGEEHVAGLLLFVVVLLSENGNLFIQKNTSPLKSTFTVNVSFVIVHCKYGLIKVPDLL